MPGPRKNLTPLDMKMMGSAFNQGGIINFLGKQPEVTAPVRAQSHADSPPVQLAYITDAEKDLLVKSNIHGSMDGKPNPGPAGLPSLDDFFNTPDGGVSGGSTSNTGGSVGGGGSSGGGTSAEDYGIFGGGQSGQQFGGAGGAGMAVGSDGTVYDQTQYSGPGINFNQSQIAVTDEEQKKLEELAAQKQALVQAGIQQAQEQQDTLLGKTKTGILEGFDKLKSIFSTNELQQFTPLMLKKIQTELDKFIELGVSNPLTLRTLTMSNIGGFLSGKDQTFSDMQGNIIDPESVSINEETGKIMGMNEDGELVDVRYTREGMQDLMKERFGDDVFSALKMYAPDIGYTALGGYMPQTSGSLLNLAKNAALKTNPDGEGYITPDGRVVSEEQGKQYNNMIFAARTELDRMGKNYLTGNQQGGGQTGITSITSPQTDQANIIEPKFPATPGNPFGLPGDYGAGFMQSQFYKPGQPGLAVMTPVTLPDGTTHMFPDSSSANQFQQYLDHLAMNKMGPSVGPYQAVKTPAGVPAALNYANIAPQFTSAYAQQGIVNPLMMNPAFQQFRQNLGLFPGMA